MRRRAIPTWEAVASAAIVALAASTAWFALEGAVDRRKEETCLSNLQRIAAAMRMYEDDYGGKLVPYVSFGSPATAGARYTKLVAPYLGNIMVFRCPSDRLSTSNLSGAPPYPTTYGMNWYISGVAGTGGGLQYPGVPRANVVDPSHTVCLSDCAVIDKTTMALPVGQWREDAKAAPTADIYYFYLPWDPSGWTGSGLALVRPFPRHAGRLNVTFYDGHAETILADRIPTKATDQGQPGCIWDNVAG
ncbi:MAG TPA: hypothetical protein VGM37_13815 [Armatimonadota bacterium]|jgi:prepilin-type processing-associated H-X9-DG protein